MMKQKNKLMIKLCKFQRKGLSNEIKLNPKDHMRIIKFITDYKLFSNKCILWSGYKYKRFKYCITFYLNGKKRNIVRILFINYIDNLNNDEILRNTCNTERCVNPFHYKKEKINISNIETVEIKNQKDHIVHFG